MPPIDHEPPSETVARAPGSDRARDGGTRLHRALGRARGGAAGSPAYRRYLLAATITSASSWTFMTGLGWAMLERSGSAAVVTAVQTAMILPIPFAAIPAGLIVDRHGPRAMVVVTLLGLAAMSAVLAWLAAIDALVLLTVVPVALIFGTFDGLYVVPAQVLVARSVDRHLMAGAIALSALPLGIGRITGGPLGGFLLERGGATGAMLVGAVGLAVAGLVLWGVGRLEGLETERSSFAGLRDGVASARRTPGVLIVIVLGVAVATFVYPYLPLLPVVARDVLQAGPAQLGWLTAAGGVGGIVAAFVARPLGDRIGRGRLAVVLVAGSGIALTVLGSAPSLPLTLVAAAVLAVGTLIFGTNANMLIQAMTPPRFRGRVLALYGLAFFAAMPVGMLGSGVAADRFGVGAVLIGCGVLAAVVGCVLAAARPEFVRLDVDATGVVRTASSRGSQADDLARRP